MKGGFAVKDPERFEIIKRAWDLMATGTKSLREIREVLGEWGIDLKSLAVQRMFHNKFYCGLMVSPKYPEVVCGQHIPMITEEQFYKVQAILDGRNRSTPLMGRKSRDNMDFPLRRLVKCSKCGTAFTGAWSKGRSIRYAYYFCRNRCVMSSIPIKDINIDLSAFLTRMSPSEEGLKLYIACLLKTFNQKKSKLDRIRQIVDQEIQKLQALRQVLVEKNLAGTYSDEIFREQNAAIESKIVTAQAAKNDALVDKYNIGAIEKFLKEKLANLAITYSNSTLSQLRCLLGSIFLSGVTWGYPGISNRDVSPVYQAIRDTSPSHVPFGDPTGIRIPVLRMRI